MPPEPLKLHDALKTYCHDQDKTFSPRETIARFKQRLAQTGLDILEDVVRIDNGRLGIPVYFSLCGPEARATIGNLKQMGKGATAEQSQASAVMELGERFSLFSFLKNNRHFEYAPFTALTQPAMDFEMIAKSLNDTSDDLPAVRQFFNELPLQWTWAHNLTREEPTLVPFNWFWTINQFNGACAGNCVEEALAQGICEVVERHVSARICQGQGHVPLIDPATISDPVAQALIQKYQSNGIKVYLSDFTCDMGIPSIGALAWDPATFPASSEIVWTAGTAPHPARALCRALTEVAQLAGDFNSSGNYEASGLPKFHDIQEADYITNPGGVSDFNQLPNLGHDNIRIEVQQCLKALQNNHFETFAIDVRHPQLDIPAFYALIPGTDFRERTTSAGTAMICAKIVAETFAAGKARDLLTQLDALIPGKYFVQFYLGQIRMNQGFLDEAEGFYDNAIGLNPPDEERASIYTYLGLCRKQKEQYSAALDALRLADTIDPERTDTLNLMGFCHFKLKNHEAAIDCFKRIIALNPSSAIDYANLAVNYRAMGETSKAVENYQLALSLDPDIDFAREHLVQMGIDVAGQTQL